MYNTSKILYLAKNTFNTGFNGLSGIYCRRLFVSLHPGLFPPSAARNTRRIQVIIICLVEYGRNLSIGVILFVSLVEDILNTCNLN